MLHVLVTTYIVLIVAMAVCVRLAMKSSVKNRDSIVRLIGMGIFTSACYTVFLLVPEDYPRLAVFMNGLYYIDTVWLSVALLFFISDYTRLHPPMKAPRQILFVLAAADSVSLIVNTFTRHVFDLQRGVLQGTGYWRVEYATFQSVHLALVYLMIFYCVVQLVYQTVKSPAMYKGKYGTILLLVIGLILLDFASTLLNSDFEYSVLLYGFIAIAICYYVLYASPRRLLERMRSTLVEDSVIGLVVYDEDEQCVGVNQAAKELFTDKDDVYGAAARFLAQWKQEHQGQLKNVMGAERQLVRDGETVYIYVNYQQLLDDKGRILGSGFQFENRTEAIKQYQEEKYKASHDTLTGLYNRTAFEDEVRHILATQHEPYYMMCTNIKDFKLINELCGTEVGDALLISQADIIRNERHGESASARIYADKFCTLLPKRHYNEELFKAAMTETLDRVVSIPFKTHFYFGVYEITDRTEPVWTMCDKAMMAIDAIRGNYGEYFSFYKEEMFQRIIKEKEIIGRFDQAIEEEEFHMFLQPQVANNGTIVGAEALVRWIHPEKGMISPADFIPVLEKAGLIHKLDLYIWEKAAQKLEAWKREGKGHLSISVNISTKDFYLTDICEAFRTISEKYDFDIKNLKLEITESALMQDVRKIMRNMDELHNLGFDIEIDDFGSGYSSLGMLKDIRADILKIDMIFLHETENMDRSSTIIKNVISMSKELGMPVITEGVETKEQVDFLQNAGCDMFQGFYFARPMKVEDFEQAYSA